MTRSLDKLCRREPAQPYGLHQGFDGACERGYQARNFPFYIPEATVLVNLQKQEETAQQQRQQRQQQ